jgi:hypothetical protein
VVKIAFKKVEALYMTSQVLPVVMAHELVLKAYLPLPSKGVHRHSFMEMLW